jgi:hypothetical protein
MKFILEERFILHEDIDNWEQKYNECKTTEDFKNFWQNYYSTVWTTLTEPIKKIGIEKCTPIYGWTPAENPLLAFLAEIAKKPINGVGLKTLTRVDFEMLTTAFARKLITKEDLLGHGSFKNYNLIFNPYLYTDSADSEEQLEYLRLQRAFKNPVDAEGNPLEGNRAIIAFANLYSLKGNITELVTPISPGTALRSVTQLTRLIAKVVPTYKAKKVTKTTHDNVQEILDHIADEDAKVYFVGAFDTFETLAPNSISLADKKIAEGPKLAAYRSTITGIDHEVVKEASKKLNLARGKYSPELAAKLLIGLAVKAGADITLKDEGDSI